MRRILLGGAAAASLLLLSPALSSAALYPQCPAVGADTGCQFVVVATDGGQQLLADPAQGPYDKAEDALVGVQNNSSKPVTQVPLSAASSSLFGFEQDGLCNPGNGLAAPGCVFDPSAAPDPRAGQPCDPAGAQPCAFPPPAGEGSGHVEPVPSSVIATFPNGDQRTGYEGPTSWYTNISADTTSGLVHFDPPIPPGGAAYFGLEEPPGGKLVIGAPSTVTSTTLSGGGQTGPMISVAQGTPVTDQANVSTTSGVQPTGSVNYAVYRDPACTSGVAAQGAGAVGANGLSAPSTPANLPPGKYYWQATYNGDSQNAPAVSPCNEVLSVAAKAKVGLPSSKKCRSRRAFVIHVRVPRGEVPASGQVLINGKLAKSVTFAGRRASSITLRGLPKGRYRVQVLITTQSGKSFTDNRRYKTCTKKGH